MDTKKLKDMDNIELVKRANVLYALIHRQKNTTLEKDSLIRHLKNKVKYLENKIAKRSK